MKLTWCLPAIGVVTCAHMGGCLQSCPGAHAPSRHSCPRSPAPLSSLPHLASPPALQLALVHGQIVSLLTSTALQAMFARNPGYDARKLLGG